MDTVWLLRTLKHFGGGGGAYFFLLYVCTVCLAVRWQFFSFSTHSTGEDDKGSKDGCAPDNNAADEPNIVDVLTSMEKNNTENVDKMADDFFKSDKVTDSFPKLEKESDEISALGVLKEMQFETEVSNETEATMNVDLKGDPEEDFTGFLAEETSEENEE